MSDPTVKQTPNSIMDLPTREDLNEKEVAALIGGMISALISMVPEVGVLQRGLAWWVSPAAIPTWGAMVASQKATAEAIAKARAEATSQGGKRVVII